MDFSGISILVTGGASGLGFGTSVALAERGAKITIVDLPASAGIDVAAEQNWAFAPADILDESALDSALDLAVSRGPLRGVVHCAGRGGDRLRVLDREGAPSPLDSFESVLRTNLTGSYNVLRLAAARMRQNEPDDTGERGAIVMTASAAAYDGQIGQTSYAASKAGVVGMTLVAARDLAAHGIRVNTIAPGLFETPMLGRFSDEFREKLGMGVVFPKRLGRADEYGRLAAELLANPYLNGETVRLDGALRMPPK